MWEFGWSSTVFPKCVATEFIISQDVTHRFVADIACIKGCDYAGTYGFNLFLSWSIPIVTTFIMLFLPTASVFVTIRAVIVVIVVTVHAFNIFVPTTNTLVICGWAVVYALL